MRFDNLFMQHSKLTVHNVLINFEVQRRSVEEDLRLYMYLRQNCFRRKLRASLNGEIV